MMLIAQKAVATKGGFDASLLELVLAADEANHTLFATPRLRPVVQDLARFCDRAGHSAVYGVSEAGQRLAGALMLARPGTEPWRPGTECALLLDAIVAGLDGVAMAAHHLRRMGASTVDACIIQLIADEAQPPGIRRLYVLERDELCEGFTRAAA
jgi:hypothetical protein